MGLAIMPASAANDQPQMLQLLQRNFPGSMLAYFRWRHLDNPAGPAWSWFLYEKTGGVPVAMASVFPRYMFVDGKQAICGQVGEFAVDARYRSLGPAVMLQRATLGPVDAGAIAICYDCPPHDLAMSTFARLGMRANTEVFRYALPLRSDDFLTKRLGIGALAKPAIVTANLVLKIKLFSRGRPRMKGMEISHLEGDFGDEFTHLDRSVSSLGLIRASRSADVLNWRHRRQPHCSFRTLVARRSGELVGFLTVMNSDGRVLIWDLFGHQLEEVGAALIHAAVDLYRKENAHLLEGYSSSGSPMMGEFLKAGFTRRERLYRAVGYEKPDNQGRKMQSAGMEWAFTLVECGDLAPPQASNSQLEPAPAK